MTYRMPAFVLFLWASLQPAFSAVEATPEEEEIKRRVYAALLPEDEAGFTRLGAPRPGEWLERFHEVPQPLETYRTAAKIRPTAERRTIVLQPIGEFNDEQKKIVEAMRIYAETFFQLPTRVEPAIPLPESTAKVAFVRQIPLGHRHGTYDRQYDAGKILTQVLKKKLPADAIVYLGITMADLWEGDLNYVFGLASLSERVGVYSLTRYFPEFWGNPRKPGDDQLGLVRSCKVMNHETGHMFGLSHCVFFSCSMNGSNGLHESDSRPVHFCPVCDRKLHWNIGYDSLKRYQQLQGFYTDNKLTEPANWMSQRIKNWKKVMVKEGAAKAKEE